MMTTVIDGLSSPQLTNLLTGSGTTIKLADYIAVTPLEYLADPGTHPDYVRTETYISLNLSISNLSLALIHSLTRYRRTHGDIPHTHSPSLSPSFPTDLNPPSSFRMFLPPRRSPRATTLLRSAASWPSWEQERHGAKAGCPQKQYDAIMM